MSRRKVEESELFVSMVWLAWDEVGNKNTGPPMERGKKRVKI